MGAAVGGALVQSGHRVLWASEGRSQATAARAAAAGMVDVTTFDRLVADAEVLLSICPPHAAARLAERVAAAGFRGTFVDANAIAPATARAAGASIEAAGASFVDGGIVGPAPLRPGSTRLYLSGAEAAGVAALVTAGDLEAIVLDTCAGSVAASALKACYATWTKVSAALLLEIRALAAAEGVEEALLGEWGRSMPELVRRSDGAAGMAAKAWRFVGEMEQQAAAMAGAGLPDGFHLAAADLYQRLAVWRDQPQPPLDQVVTALLPAE
jgi:3-hydroxyisobutyrate dehydrogenase-like beta-hydroxyacid dehydrogenase